jgi:hypothetical protein
MTWNDISLRKFKEISKLDTKDELEYTSNLIKIVFDIEDPLGLSIPEFKKYVSQLDFIKDEPKLPKLQLIYNINGRKYIFKGNVFTITAAQFYDWRGFVKQQPLDYAQCMSVFFIPEGHKYNDGYDMDEVISDINDMPTPSALKMFFFFVNELRLSHTILLDYLKREFKKMTLQPEQKEAIEKMIELISTTVKTIDMTSFRTSSRTAK